jgi:cytochrome c2
MKRTVYRVCIAIVLALAAVTPAQAGGWVVVTVEELPRTVSAGEHLSLAFMVRQHGTMPVNLENPGATVILSNRLTGERTTFEAHQDGELGRYVAEVQFPSAGSWTMEIAPGAFEANLVATLEVGNAQPAAPALRPERWLAWLAPLTAALALAPAARQGRLGKNGALVTGIAVAVLAAGAAWWSAVPAVTAQPAQESAQAEYGQALFVAKGCATCHVHSEAAARWTTNVGPVLTDYVAAPEFVHTWLKDPQAIKPATEMPNLELREEEIDALVAFLVGSKS